MIQTLVGVGAGLAALPGMAQLDLTPTPAQSEGPFYPPESDRFSDIDHDLVKLDTETKKAGGQILHLLGVIQTQLGVPIADASIEIWQCDVNGRYIHRFDRDQGSKRDRYFQGFGRTASEAGGEYYFRTILPVPYTGRAPHIHYKIDTPLLARPLITQMYIADEPLNQWDGLYRRLNSVQKSAVTTEVETINGNEFLGRFDIVLGV